MSDDSFSLHDYIDAQEQRLRREVSIFIEEFYGERCDMYERSCLICRKWRALDMLFDDSPQQEQRHE